MFPDNCFTVRTSVSELLKLISQSSSALSTFNVNVSSCKIFLSYFAKKAFSLKELLPLKIISFDEVVFKDVNSGKRVSSALLSFPGRIVRDDNIAARRRNFGILFIITPFCQPEGKFVIGLAGTILLYSNATI